MSYDPEQSKWVLAVVHLQQDKMQFENHSRVFLNLDITPLHGMLSAGLGEGSQREN